MRTTGLSKQLAYEPIGYRYPSSRHEEWTTKPRLREIPEESCHFSGTFYAAGVRIIFASLVALVLSWFLEGTPGKEHILPVVSFLTGMLPEQALLYLQERSRIFANAGAARSRELPLTAIEGINTFHKVRLGEVAIDNVQNLAEVNLMELLLRTPFPSQPAHRLDCPGQASGVPEG